MFNESTAQLRSVAKRYQQRTTPKDRARGAGKRPKVGAESDTRKRYLAQNLSHERAFAMVKEAEAHGASNRIRALASLSQERIIGSSDLVDINYLEFAIAVGRAVCRIRIGSASATGFLVGPGVMMTNHHVIESSADADQAEAQFDYQENRSGEILPVQSFRVDPSIFFLTNPALDFTLVGLTPTSQAGRPIHHYPWLELIGAIGKADKGDPLNIIQHPRGGLKQIALRNNEVIEIPTGQADFLYYTTDTEPGSSGSPCFNDQWELVALHHSGVPKTRDDQILKKDGSVWREGVDDPALIDWVANEGARVSAIVSAIRSAALPATQDALRARLLSERPPNPVELARSSVPRPDHNGVHMNTASGISLSVPLTITVSLGGQALSTAGGNGAVAGDSAIIDVTPSSNGDSRLPGEEAVKIDPNWSNREGYDLDFLGTKIPLPVLSSAMKKVTAEVPPEFRKGDKYVLPYHHYSIAMNKKRRFAWYSAANVDGDLRPKLPKRSGDRWFIDPRIDDPKSPTIQCGEELYATTKTDRGHLTRYLDLGWGESLDEATRALNDTFHFTNCTLQLSNFNQSKDRWQGIEQFLLEQKAKKERRRIVVITGPLFTDTDPRYRNEYMSYSVRIPLQFWKVCGIIRESDNKLAATAFILGQEDIEKLPGFEEAFDVVAAQVTVKELEDRTGLDFGVLTKHDHFAKTGKAGTLEINRAGGKRKVKPLRSVDDIVV